ncbi:MAG: PTS system mannose/fructose/sorbose family transporter subunit IID [Eubacteriales bacterium]|nr:PTS system mannose/fructose/sorbose family transporter subunit IID [Eubacteriales bacterium]
MSENNTALKKRSDFKKYLQFFWRSWAIQASWNYERQMNMGFLYGIAPTLDELYPNENDPEQLAHKKEAYERHMAFYNCTPQTSAFVLGLAASMEEQYAADREHFNPETINAVKTSLMGPLSGVGDSFFQGTVKIIAFGLGISLAQQGSILGPILAILISLIPSWFVTWFGGKLGYTMGSKYLTKLQSGNLMDQLMYVCGVVGLMVIGAMVASMVGIVTPIAFESSGLVMQDIVDGILPQAISLVVTLGMFTLIRKRVSTGWLLALCIFGGVAINALGILA